MRIAGSRIPVPRAVHIIIIIMGVVYNNYVGAVNNNIHVLTVSVYASASLNKQLLADLFYLRIDNLSIIVSVLIELCRF